MTEPTAFQHFDESAVSDHPAPRWPDAADLRPAQLDVGERTGVIKLLITDPVRRVPAIAWSVDERRDAPTCLDRTPRPNPCRKSRSARPAISPASVDLCGSDSSSIYEKADSEIGGRTRERRQLPRARRHAGDLSRRRLGSRDRRGAWALRPETSA